MKSINHPRQPRIETLQDFEQILKKGNLPLEKWTGQQGTKTIEDLFKEAADGETEIETTPNGEVVRIVHVVTGDITYLDEETHQLYRLKEDRQVSKVDESIKKRPHLHGAVAEKMKVGEDPVRSVLRGIKEELGISGNFETGEEKLIEESRTTESYPGLNSIYKVHVVPVRIDESNFKPEGYVENQEKKTNYFVWEKI